MREPVGFRLCRDDSAATRLQTQPRILRTEEIGSRTHRRMEFGRPKLGWKKDGGSRLRRREFDGSRIQGMEKAWRFQAEMEEAGRL